MASARFFFGFDSFKVENCRSKGDHNDSDWLTVTVTSGQTVFPTQTALIGGNLHAGDVVGPVLLGPFDVDRDKLVTVTFGVVNLSHTDDQGSKIEGIGLTIGGAVFAAIAGFEAAGPAVETTAGKIGDAVVGAVGGVLSTIGGLILGESNPDCDGEVLSRTLSFLPGELKPQSIGPNLETAVSPEECGNPPRSTVVYGLSLVVGGPILVITNDGSVFAHDLVGNTVGLPFELSGPKVAANPQDKHVLIVGSRILVITNDGSAFAHDLDTVGVPFQLSGPKVAANPQDKFVLF